jgi:hypothetical protein
MLIRSGCGYEYPPAKIHPDTIKLLLSVNTSLYFHFYTQKKIPEKTVPKNRFCTAERFLNLRTKQPAVKEYWSYTERLSPTVQT